MHIYTYMSSSQLLETSHISSLEYKVVFYLVSSWKHRIFQVLSTNSCSICRSCKYSVWLVDWLRGWLIGLGSIALVTVHGWVYRRVQINIST